jgi:hypothetical protein
MTKKHQEYGNARYLYSRYKKDAKYRKICFDLSFEVFLKTTRKNCFYCNIEPYTLMDRKYKGKSRHKEIYVYNGLDRYNNDIGYIDTNIVPCCQDCNYAKLDMSTSAFIELIRAIHAKNRIPNRT